MEGSACASCLSAGRGPAPLGGRCARLYSALAGEVCARTNLNIKVEEMLICWECRAVLHKTLQFQQKTARAQNWLEWAHGQQSANVFQEVKSFSTLSVSQIKTLPDIEMDYERNMMFIPEADSQILNNEDSCFAELKPVKEEVHDGISVHDESWNVDLEKSEIAENTDIVDPQSFNQSKINIDECTDIIKCQSDKICNSTEIESKEKAINKSVPPRGNVSKKVSKKVKNEYKKKYYLKRNCEIERSYYNTIGISEEEMLKLRDDKRISDVYYRRPYKCESCICGYISKADLNEHNAKRHYVKNGPYICNICKIRTKTKLNLEKHVQGHYLQYRCKLCGYVAWKLDQMFSHKRNSHRDGRIYGCRKCDVEFRTLVDFRYHWKTLHVKYCCDKCNKICKSRDMLKLHFRSKHVIYQCDICKKVFKTDKRLIGHKRAKHRVLVKPQRPSSPSQRYCVECDRKFTCITNLKMHIYNMHNPKRPQHECTHCQKVFKNKRAMNNHYNLEHLKKTDHHCSICNKYFIHTYSLQKHTRCVHGGHRQPKNKFCSVCGRAFNSNATLTNHMRTHTGERPYQCDYCSASFAQRTALHTHIKHIHLNIKRSATKQ